MARQKLTTRQKESIKINRRRAVRQRAKTVVRRVVIILVLLMLVSTAPFIWWLKHSEKPALLMAHLSDGFWQTTVAMGFKLENVYLEGRNLTPLYDISKATGVKTDEPILRICLEDIRTRLEAIPRVKSAEVGRILPNQLHIKIIEREPVAIWQNEGKFYLVDSEGVVMESTELDKYPDLLLVVGEGAPAHTRQVFEMLQSEPELAKNVVAVLRIGERRWNIRFKNGIELKLPEKKEAEAWHNFAGMERDNHVLSRSIKVVDMRIYDRIFIKLVPQETEKPEKEVTTGSDT